MAVEEKALNKFKVEYSKEAEKFIRDKGLDEINIKMEKKSIG